VPRASGLLSAANGTILELLPPGTTCAEASQRAAPGARLLDLRGRHAMPVGAARLALRCLRPPPCPGVTSDP
jgi:hypothetical protein